METILSFFLRSALVSGTLYGYYRLFLKDRKFNHLNRIFLLSIFPVSLVLPLVRGSWLQWSLPGKIADGMVSAEESGQLVERIFFVLGLCYVAVLVVLLSSIGWKVNRLFRLKKRSDRRMIDGFCLVETEDPRAPFVFFNNLFWKQGEDPGTADNAKILEHELVHIRGYHSYDRLFSQLCCGVCWINPFFWWIQGELATIHEFLADEGSFDQGDTGTFAKMILRSYQQGHYLTPDLSFSKSDIERRIGMVSRVAKKNPLWKKALLVMALTAFLVTTFATISYTRNKPLPEDRLKALEEKEQKLKDERSRTAQSARP